MIPLPLPIDGSLAAIRAHLAADRAVVIVAPPGAGKTTRVPPALAADGPVIVLQPRRVAARAIARRIAGEQGWTLGREVGWQVRFERRFSPETRVLLATEGILTARLQVDPFASDFRTIVLDEFHERSIHADLALALARQAWLARGDLRLVVMSATLEAAPVSAFLGDCPCVEIAARPHPLAVVHAPGGSLRTAVEEVLRATTRSVLCFLPGSPEIRRAQLDLAGLVRAADLVPLHGSLDAEAQDRALQSTGGRRLVLATNIAETSLTVPDVDAVVDTGLHKVARYDAARGIDSLVTERISQASAAQRSGRAARTGPGRAVRLWDARDRLRPAREPDVARIDLAGPLLDIAASGADPLHFDWFEAPPPDAVERAWRLLARLGAVAGRTLTPLGRRMQAFPIDPRLARALIAAGGAFEACAACALLAERAFLPPRTEATSCDLLPAIDAWTEVPPHVQQVARQIQATAAEVLGREALRQVSDEDLRRALFAGYPDRLARRREPRGSRLQLASGTGATLAAASGVVDAEFLVALDVAQVGAEPEPRVRLASRVERAWITATSEHVEHAFDAASGRVRAIRRARADSLVLAEHPAAPDPGEQARLLAEAWLERGPRGAQAQLIRRLAFAGIAVDLAELARSAAAGARTIDEVDPGVALPHEAARALERDAPASLVLPSGRRTALDYGEDGTVALAVRLQEIFGLDETPRVGARGTPVLLRLLAPNGRPVQTTRDLPSFWATTYPEVRKALRGRYPKHAWPEDPRAARPTSRPVPRRKG